MVQSILCRFANILNPVLMESRPLMVLYALNFALLMLSFVDANGAIFNIISTYIGILQPMLVSRLFLNLKEAGRAHTTCAVNTITVSTTEHDVAFASGPVLGNIGGPLSFNDSDYEGSVVADK